MAYTKVFAIRARLDDRVKYAINGDKTELGEKINYAADLQKMNSVRFVSALNCKSAETAFAAMRRTKEKFCKTGGVLGYHFIQSFAPERSRRSRHMRSDVSLHGGCSARTLRSLLGHIWTKPIRIITSSLILCPA